MAVTEESEEKGSKGKQTEGQSPDRTAITMCEGEGKETSQTPGYGGSQVDIQTSNRSRLTH